MKKFLFSLLGIISTFNVFSQYGGNQTYAFLDLPNSAHSVALGGINLSVKDVNSVFNNPALLDSNMLNYLTFSYVNYFAGINWGYCSYTFSNKKYGNFAASAQYINYGKFIEANENGDITGKFYASDYTLALLWNHRIDSLFTFGLTLKPVFSFYEKYFSFGLALDLGLNYISVNKLFSAAFVVSNFGSQIKPYVIGQYEKIPFNVSVGVSQRLAHAPFRFSVVVHHLNKLDLSYDLPVDNTTIYSQTIENKLSTLSDLALRHFIFGAEIIPSENFYLSFGFNYQRRQELKLSGHSGLSGFSAGLGIKVKKFTFNYGISRFNNAGSMQTFTISLKMNNLNKNY